VQCSGPQVPTSRKPTTQQLKTVVLWVFRQHNKMELLCCGRTHNTTPTTVTQKCQRPENPQHNNLKLLCCGFSGRWHLWATVRSAVTVTVTLCLHFTAGCTTGCMNYANEPSQAAIERARQDDYGVIASTHAATRLCGQ